MKLNGIKHITSAPYHPATNGLAERAVQTFKRGMKSLGESGSIETRVSRFLMSYRNTPQTTTGQTPAFLMMKRNPRTRLELLKPDLKGHVYQKQAGSVYQHDQHGKSRDFYVGDPVYFLNFGRGPKWFSGNIVSRTGPLSYLIESQDGRIYRRHQDQIRFRHQETSDQPVPSDVPPPVAVSNPPPVVPNQTVDSSQSPEWPTTPSPEGDTPGNTVPKASVIPETQENIAMSVPPSGEKAKTPNVHLGPSRRSQRVRKMPQRLICSD
jgi:hypothetical protein